jgi:hypothetical protein
MKYTRKKFILCVSVVFSAIAAVIILIRPPRESLGNYIEKQIQALGDLSENTKENAEKRVRCFALRRATDWPSAEYRAAKSSEFRATRLGPTSWTVYSRDRLLNPSSSYFYAVVTADGTVHPSEDSAVWDLIKNELKPKFSDSDHEQFLLHYLYLHRYGQESYMVIGNVSEIPGYTTASLSPELESQIRPPYWLSENVYQLFLYGLPRGRVVRYRCQYDRDKNFIDSEVKELAIEIGHIHYSQ